MRFAEVISALCLLLSVGTLAAPAFGGVSEVSNDDRVEVSKRNTTPVDHGAIGDRAVPIIATIVRSIVKEVVEEAIDFITDMANMNEKKEGWVEKSMALLTRKYPSLNIVIYSNHKGTYNFGGSDHTRKFDYDLSIAFGVEETYHILFSDNVGWFQRAGDGGYINWMLSPGDDFRSVRPQDDLIQFKRK